MRYITHELEVPHEGEDFSLYRESLQMTVETRDVTEHEGALALPYLDTTMDRERVRKHLGEVSHVFLVGIGGSSLGTDAVFRAVSARGSDVVLTIFDTVSDARILRAVRMLAERKIPKDKVAIVIISKSGSTTETITNSALLLSALEKHYSDTMVSRTVVITDDGSALDTLAQDIGYEVFHLPHAIGGRYSVFSNVGIIPLTLLRVDVDAFLRGAHEKIDALLLDGNTDAIHVAHLLARTRVRGITTLDTFVFDSPLKAYAEWRRQLLAESLGKSVDKKGAEGVFGPLPTVSTAADLHSVAQLYLSGARCIHTDFITLKTYGDTTIPLHPLLKVIPYLEGKTTTDVSEALVRGVLEAYKDQKLSYSEYCLEAINEYEIGALMASNMLETMYAASCMNVDAFNQPNVELYKTKTRAKLEGM